MSDPDRDLVLEYTTVGKEGEEEFRSVILSNIKGQRYTMGSLYPGEREGEEFLFCRVNVNEEGVVSPTHCAITVDERGRYWIQNDTGNVNGVISFNDTYVNSEKVLEPRLLKIGDVIGVGYPETIAVQRGLRPFYQVKERAPVPVPAPLIVEGSRSPPFTMINGDSPLDNDLIFSEIMSYLPVVDLKNARLVCKGWKGEASKVLEKKGQVSFDFGGAYVNPECSTKVARYLHEMNGLNIQNLHIRLQQKMFITRRTLSPLLLSPGEPGEKMLNDLRKLFNSTHNFSSLFVQGDISKDSDFVPLSLIFQGFGEKLRELKLEGQLCFVPDDIPSFPKMYNLRKFTHKARAMGTEDMTQKWVSHLVPLFTKNLEHFSCHGDRVEEAYLQELLKLELPKLKEIETGLYEISDDCLSLLLQLKAPLTLLKICYRKFGSEPGQDCILLEKLLFKNSKSLKHIEIIFSHDHEQNILEIKFPSFPKLEELILDFESPTNVTWGIESLDYKEHLPALRNLTILRYFVKGVYENGLVFDAFLSENEDRRCETVKKVRVLQGETQQTMDKIKETFPNSVISTQWSIG